MSKEQWNERFSSESFVYGETENEFVNHMHSLIPEHAKVGCFAEGEGRNAVFLARQGCEVTTYDQSTVGLEKTQHLAEKYDVTVRTIEQNLTTNKVPIQQFDAAIMVFGHVPKHEQAFFIQNIIDSVKPGGHIIFEVYSEEQLKYSTGGPGVISSLYNPTDVLSWISDYQCIHFFYGEAERHEGKGHTGQCHVIQVAIKK